MKNKIKVVRRNSSSEALLNGAAQKRKKAFILAYSVMVMTFIMILLTTAFTMLQSVVSAANVSKNNFISDKKFSQIEEYVLVGNYYMAENEAKGSSFYVNYSSYTENGASVLEVYVYENGEPRLYVKRINGRFDTYVYGEKPE